MLVDQDRFCLLASVFNVEATGGGQFDGALGSGRENGVVERKSHGQLGVLRLKGVAADGALFEGIVEGLYCGVERCPGCSEILRGAGERKMLAGVDHGDYRGAAQVLRDEFTGKVTDGNHLGTGIGTASGVGGGAHQQGEGEGFRRLVDGHFAQGSLGVSGGLVDDDSEVAQLFDGGDLAEHDAGDGYGRGGVERGGSGSSSASHSSSIPFEQLLEALDGAWAARGDGSCGRAGDAAGLGEHLPQVLCGGGGLRGVVKRGLPIGALSCENDGWIRHGMQWSQRHFPS